MERHKCKLCFRNFSNGRALGGHMRSHMMNLQVPPKPNESPPTVQLSFEAESSSSFSSGEEGGEENKGLSYELRENPKRSLRISDPEFSLAAAAAAAADTGSVILQDRESETESSKNVTRRRSKRAWKLSEFNHNNNKKKQMRPSQLSNRNESASSVSDTTTEEDVAFCLMMLSRDSRDGSKWRIKIHKKQEEEEDDEEDEDEDEEEEEEDEEDDEEEEEEEESDEEELKKSLKAITTTKKVRGRYKCDTCHKVFRSYQALGGHRASHKKIKVVDHHHHHHEPESMELERDGENATYNNNNKNNSVPNIYDNGNGNGNSNNNNNNNSNNNSKKKIHECPVCFRIFTSGQALGGHKRTHVTNASGSGSGSAPARVEEPMVATSRNVTSSSTMIGRGSFIDLNLPAPVDDDDASQFEDSAVSDAEFVKKVKILPR